MASNDETTNLYTTGEDVATGHGDSGPNGQGSQGSQDTAAGAPDGAAVPAAEPAPAKKAARKRAPRKATAARTTPAHHDAETVTGTPDTRAAAGGATEVPAASAPAEETPATPAPDEDAAPKAKRAPRKAAKRAPRKSAKKAAAAPSAEVAEAPEGTADLLDEETDETLSDVTADTTPQTTTLVPPAPEAAADGGTVVEETPAAQAPAEASETAAESERRAPAATAGLGLLFQAPDATAAPRRRRATAPAAAPAASEAPARAETPEVEEADRSAGRATGRPESTESEVDADAEGEGGGRRRRRRGGKGRKARASGDGAEADASSADGQVPAEDTTAAATATGDTGETAVADEEGPEETEDNEGGPSRRRTRRRRRGGAGSGESEEQPGVVTRVREPRKERDEVTSVKGSTRLEAKKQRRREGREAGRRRTIITEAEFLARRESVERVMVVRNKDDRTQIAVLEDKVLVEHYVSRESNVSMAGNIYLGRVQNVLPSMEAAFVDIGKGRNAVLYAGEVNWDAAGLSGNRAKRIENALSSGDGVLVQVTKDPIGHKGARLTSQISLPGRYLVYVPDGNMTGISRKLPDTERARLKKILREIVPENAGVIVRTAAEGASEDELRADVARLTATWEDIKAKASSSQTKAPALLHGEPDLTVRVIRDVFNEDFASLVVAGEPAWSQVSGYVSSVAPDLADRVTKWTGEQDLFTHYRVDEQIAKAMDRKVWLPSGGSLVIDRTEAMTVVDVNTGKFVGSGGNLEETVTKNNIEAAEEVVRQLRLRDIGGIIVIDFIDMVLESNRDLVVRRLLECLGRDRTKHQVAEVTSLGLVQMTRKRVGSGLIEVFSEPCEHCNGRGFIIHADPVDQNGGNGSGARDNGNRGGDNGSRGGDNGSAAGDGARGSRSRRGRGGRDQGGPAQAEPAPAAPSGPTPAQIAAAAHQAALLASQAVADDDTRVGDGEVTLSAGLQGIDATEAIEAVETVETLEAVESPQPAAVQPPETEPQVPDSVEAEREQPAQAEAPAQQDTVAAEPEAAPVPEHAAAPAAQPEAAPVPDEAAAPAAQPATRGRRKRARVIAPAGPPGSATATPVGEFAEQGADHVV